MKSKNLITMLILSVIIILFIPQSVHADMGPKPSVTIFVKNFKSQSYYLDLLTKDSGIQYEDFYDYYVYVNDIKEMPFYKYNEGGWMATHIRNPFLHGSLKGEYNEKKGFMVHSFSYRDVPKTFKIIVQYENGDLVVSDVITPRQFNAKVLLDLETGKVTKIPLVSYDLLYFLFLIVLTVILELIIAGLFKFKKYMLIIKVNILTQLILHSILVYMFDIISYKAWFIVFLILELLVVIIEFYIYSFYSKEYNRSKLLKYTLCANFTTFIIGLLMKSGLKLF
jgi:hypothetical protein